MDAARRASRSSGGLGVLDADEDVLVVGSDHYLVLLAAHTQEAQVIGRVHVAHHCARLCGQVVDQPGVLHRRTVVQSCADRDACTYIKFAPVNTSIRW